MFDTKRTLLFGVATVGALLTPAVAWADVPAGGAEFGDHVVQCAQTMGFDGEHNPGMHSGFAGWDPAHVC